MATRKKRVILPIEEKQKVIKIKEAHPEMKFSDVVEEYYKLSKQIISVAAAQKFWSNRDSILKGEDGKTKSNISVSEETIKRIEEARAAEKEISVSFVIEQAQKVVQEYKLNADQYYFSPDWARDIMKGKANDTVILKPIQSTQRKNNSGTNTDSIRRLVGVSEGEKHRILEKEDQSPSLPPKETVKRQSEKEPEKQQRDSKRVSVRSPRKEKKTTSANYIEMLQSFLESKGETRDYKSILYDILEESYQKSPYFAPIMEKELESVKKTLQFMVDKESHKW